jgi:AcrR family transcriptional regulator
MARPNLSKERRAELVPVLAQAFADLGYRRATTAELAERCGLRENQLYRLWPNKKAMFLAAIDYLYEFSARKWRELLSQDDGRSPAERILSWEGEHRGETGLHRITFAGLSETDDPDVCKALRQMYRRFHQFIVVQVAEHRGGAEADRFPDAELTAWAIIGLGMMTNITQELKQIPHKTRGRMVKDVGTHLLNGQRANK